MSKIPFSELEAATYCPRKLYYQRRDEVADICAAIRQMTGRDDVTEDELLQLTRRIDSFYQKSAR